MIKALALDPRPDLVEDHESWATMLLIADRAYHPGHEKREVAGILHGLRALGARLERNEAGTLRLVPGEIESAEYGDYRERYLLAHVAEVRDVLALAASSLRGAEVVPGCPVCGAGLNLREWRGQIWACDRCALADLRAGIDAASA